MLTILVALSCNSANSASTNEPRRVMHCAIATNTVDENSFDQNLALYLDVDTTKEHTIMTIIKSNGEVLKDVDFEELFKGLSLDELEALKKELDGGKIAYINVEKDQEQLALGLGDINFSQEISMKVGTAVIQSLDAKMNVVMDYKYKLSVTCMEN
jgi:hypothetical protein